LSQRGIEAACFVEYGSFIKTRAEIDSDYWFGELFEFATAVAFGQLHKLNAADDGFQFRISIEVVELRCEFIVGPKIVGVEKCDYLSFSNIQPSISGCGGSAVFLTNEFNVFTQTGGDIGCFVRRAVVDHYDLQRRIVLFANAFDGLSEIG